MSQHMTETEKLKKVFSSNLSYLMQKKDKKIADLATELGIAYTTVSSWVHGDKYPRMDKVQMLADYFNVLKSDLTEEKKGMKDTVLFQNGKTIKYDDLPEEGQKELESFAQYLRQKYSR